MSLYCNTNVTLKIRIYRSLGINFLCFYPPSFHIEIGQKCSQIDFDAYNINIAITLRALFQHYLTPKQYKNYLTINIENVRIKKK